MKPLVSIIIPIVKNDPHIKENLSHIEESYQTNHTLEVIVVDEGLERSAQRNIGIKKAKGKYLLILDSDMMISLHLIDECVWLMEPYKEVVGIYIPEHIVTPGWFGRLRNWERQFYTATLVDVVRFVRADNCPLFDETLHGVEDSDWERRMPGKKITCDSHFDHHDKIGVIKYLRKKSYYAQSLDAYKKKNPDDKLLTFKYRCWQVFIEDGKWKRLVKSPHLALMMFALLFARGIVLLCRKKS